MARIIDREVYEARLAAGLVCAKHPAYKGLRKPRIRKGDDHACYKCMEIYNARVASGTKERKVRENGRTDKYNDGLTVNGLADNQMHIVSSRVQENETLDPVFGLITAKLSSRNFENHVNGDIPWNPTTHGNETYAQKREREGRSD
jgi:hypothetical protein